MLILYIIRIIKDISITIRNESEHFLYRSAKKTKINKSGAHTTLSNANTNLNIDDNELEFCSIDQKVSKA